MSAPFTRDDLERHHLAYDEGAARRFLERLLLDLPADPGRTVAQARRLLATGITGNREAAARLLLAVEGDAPTELLEESLAGEDAALRLEAILALKRRGRRFYEPEIEEYILSHERFGERLRMAARYVASTGGGDGLLRALIADAAPGDLAALADTLVAAGKRALCPDLRGAVERSGVPPALPLLLAAAALGCGAAGERLAAAAAQAAASPSGGIAFLESLLALLLRAPASRIPGETVGRAVAPFLAAPPEGERLHLLASLAALAPAPFGDLPAALAASDVPDLAGLAALARRGPSGLAADDLPVLSARARGVAYAVLGDAAFGDPALLERLLDLERGTPAFAFAAASAARLHVATAPSPLLDALARLAADDAPLSAGLAAAADLRAPLLRAGRLGKGDVRRCLAACGRA